ncbi:DinB family protein [Cohnella sp. GbtcB17]|uniref:DinB family protein n=1 Tax=Cohnella sp. GbtcB17 TaxID=2824762 RepID=UPI001C2FE50C|nr:DinB family protein [Cohnella sp. GbtcB17]
MSKRELLLDSYDHGYDKEDWFPPIKDALDGVSEEQADWKPEGVAVNSIRQNVFHLLFYKLRLLRALRGEPQPAAESSLSNDDTFEAAALGDPPWSDAVRRLEEAHAALRAELAGSNDEKLERPIPETRAWSYANGIVRHDAYHLGQIVQLRKLQGSWPAHRSFD